MQDGRKAVWRIPYVSVAFFSSLKNNFIAYRYQRKWLRTDEEKEQKVPRKNN